MNAASDGRTKRAASGVPSTTSGAETTRSASDNAKSEPTELLARQRELIAWASTLPDNWTFYATMTFRHSQTAMSAVMKLRSWLSSFRTDPRWQVFRILYCVEPHKTGSAHIHALLETSRGPYLGHCKRCSHEDNGSCKRVKLTRVNSAGSVVTYNAPHGSSVDSPTWKHLNESWFCHFGMARFMPYDPTLKFGAIAYVTKYLFKTDLLEWGYEDEIGT